MPSRVIIIVIEIMFLEVKFSSSSCKYSNFYEYRMSISVAISLVFPISLSRLST